MMRAESYDTYNHYCGGAVNQQHLKKQRNIDKSKYIQHNDNNVIMDNRESFLLLETNRTMEIFSPKGLSLLLFWYFTSELVLCCESYLLNVRKIDEYFVCELCLYSFFLQIFFKCSFYLYIYAFM